METKHYRALGPDEVLRVGDEFKPRNSETWVVVDGLAGGKVRDLAPGSTARRECPTKQYSTLSLDDVLQHGDEFKFAGRGIDWYAVTYFAGRSVRQAQQSAGGVLEARRPIFRAEELEWEKVKRDDVLVANALLAGVSLEQIIVKLVADREKLAQQLIDTFNLLPRKYRFPDGSVRVWHAPDELIPLTKLPGQ